MNIGVGIGIPMPFPSRVAGGPAGDDLFELGDGLSFMELGDEESALTLG